MSRWKAPLGNIYCIHELYQGAGNFIKLLDIKQFGILTMKHLPVFCLVTQITQIMSDNGKYCFFKVGASHFKNNTYLSDMI